MPKVSDVLSQARKCLGIQENPPHSNRTPIGVAFGWNGVPWCAEFVSIVLLRGGFKIKRNASAPLLYSELHANGWKNVRSSQTRAGDVVFFNWNATDRGIDHVGFVEGTKSDGRLITIEGNTTLPNGNGGVARRVRATSTVAKIVRPPYKKKATA
jgi:hypothetical protein